MHLGRDHSLAEIFLLGRPLDYTLLEAKDSWFKFPFSYVVYLLAVLNLCLLFWNVETYNFDNMNVQELEYRSPFENCALWSKNKNQWINKKPRNYLMEIFTAAFTIATEIHMWE